MKRTIVPTPDDQLDPQVLEQLTFERWRVHEITKMLNTPGLTPLVERGLMESLGDAERNIERLTSE